jgi:hypoxanthine phosphoribosyltransferase
MEKYYFRFYKDLKEVLIDHATIMKRVEELALQITEDYADRKPHLVGILKGANVFHADLMRAIHLPVTVDFIAVSSYGNSSTTTGEVRILKDPDESLAGRDVILVEDIVDTGLTLNYLLQILRKREPHSLKVATLLSKPSRRQVDVPVDYIGFEIPDRFVVGYGLDYAQKYRNLPFLAVVEIAET